MMGFPLSLFLSSNDREKKLVYQLKATNINLVLFECFATFYTIRSSHTYIQPMLKCIHSMFWQQDRKFSAFFFNFGYLSLAVVYFY